MLIFPIFVNAEEDCIFNNFIYLNGSAICEINCEAPLIKIRELSNLCIIPKSSVKVYFEPTPYSDKKPDESLRKTLSEPFCIHPPMHPIGYYYRVAPHNKTDKPLKIEVLNNKQFQEECTKKSSSTTKPNSKINNGNNINVNIIGNKGSVTVGDIGTQNIQDTYITRPTKDSGISLKEYLVQVAAIITGLLLDKIVIDWYLKMRKNKKSKSKKQKIQK